ncbi:MAG: orotate phosphoribosyltransferase [Candidatus Fluviicola riflensis]|nr:MAG: orotate phosphoribosyltransferase [Candidatus Fluviicola riflensis]OGS76157.1 MAG: orotate phosphoribosyltransferase [Candidatus Fluviicola riflensis]OGS83299.1 MAG: orotate phosphoribosyltransferase [Fluviicola sp. RIFCSPHIGHO2_01_FULL_43_53]OGS83689.1 MAG: orotate phosphoribosyltransferase [Fluviicola sp. RIFCSPHIGHO2_12_FULL_43_24]
MILNKDRALKVAEFLLQIKAVKLQPAQPFTWASGWSSPIYCDNRKTLSFPAIRTHIRQGYAEAILEKFGKPDVIAGVATGGIAQGALVAQELGIPFIYVRSSAKGHGMGNQIEGHFEKGQKVIVIEDLISTGGSSLVAVEALREAGCDVKGLIAIFTYGFDIAIENFKAADCPFVTLTDYDHLIDQAVKLEYINEADVQSLKKWRNSPGTWSAN